MTTAETLILSLLLCIGDMSKLTTECSGEWWEIPAIPEILISREVLGNCKFCTRRSDMNEVDEPESRRARAFRTIPSGEYTSTWHVMRSVLDENPVAAWLLTGVANGSFCSDVESKAWVSGIGSMCSKVWCGLWHLRHLLRLWLRLLPLRQAGHRLSSSSSCTGSVRRSVGVTLRFSFVPFETFFWRCCFWASRCCFYQPAVHFARGRLVLRLLSVFRVYIYRYVRPHLSRAQL